MIRRSSWYMSMGKQEQGGWSQKNDDRGHESGDISGATNYGATAVALRVLEACRAEKRRGEGTL